ncbi:MULTISPECIES: hypothetical protein [unclassified Corynebacterium]|uniref:hypothetical protein n=1 Tax=unclassified Corynebacterium TaxID=2624378 RepID=UPI0008A34B97|nr:MULTISPECIES: hypothetical protein [unclassified Corynebacterium]OFP35916.1 hypothetical protein HMPREF2990_07370 [Corynebacterium sp. HMSC071B10]OHF36662.1 hypothetical protein HMPREF2550_06780 [Corynebacterium sp. HMSC074A01]
MRNFRKAALAGATAVAVAFGSTTMAVAEDKNNEQETQLEQRQPGKDTEGAGSLSSKIGNAFEATDENGKATGADGKAIFGSTKDGFGDQPAWAKAFYALTVFSAVSAFIGLVVGPSYNFVIHGLPNL